MNHVKPRHAPCHAADPHVRNLSHRASIVPTLLHNLSNSFRVLASIILVEIGSLYICRRGSIGVIKETMHEISNEGIETPLFTETDL